MTPHPAVSRTAGARSPGSERRAALPRFQCARIRAATIVAVLVLGGLVAGPAQAAPTRPMLLSTSAASRVTDAATQAPDVERSVGRQRPVSIDFQALDPTSGAAPAEIDVELFDAQVVTLERDRVERRGPGNYTWYGVISGHDNGEAILTVVDGRISGSITLFDAGARTGTTYQIHSGKGGDHALRQIDHNGFPPDHPPGAESRRAPGARGVSPATDAGATASASAPTSSIAAADSGATIDVMVVYSNQTAAAAGAAIGAQIQQAVDTANAVYANSGIATRLRLVHYEQVSYNESGDFGTDLDRLTNGADGYMDNVPALRDTYGADLVSLFVENGQYCGIAWIGPSPNYGFSVVNRSCASANYSFPHELGHNFGARHDVYVDASATPYAYGHGLTYPAGGWRTVMAYNNACIAAGTSCTRIPYFSNPNLTFGNPAHALGKASTADNTRVLNDGAVTIASFRGAAATPGCTYTLNPASASVAAGGGTGSTTLTTGANCPWSASSSATNWLTVSTATSGTGGTTIGWSAAANTGAQRSANLSIGGATFTVTEAAAQAPATAVATLSASSLDFGTLRVGKTSVAQSVKLTNTGSGTLTIASFAKGGANPGDFPRNGTCDQNTALAGGQSCTLQFKFAPTAVGSRSATFAVATSAGAVNLNLSGQGK